MDRKHNKSNVPFARTLRKNMTKEERHLWYDFLRDYPVKIKRQTVLGKYIVDFYCAKAKLVIELDGSQYYEDSGIDYDLIRSKYLEEYGLKIVRIQNPDVNNNFQGVCLYIDHIIKDRMGDNPSVSQC